MKEKPICDSKFWNDCVPYLKNINEDNCCTVIALAIVTGEPLDSCFRYMSLFGRVPRKGMYIEETKFALSKSKKYKFIFREFEKPMTIKSFCKEHPKGKYYVRVSGHILAIIDSVVYDHSDRPLRRITHAWRVYNKEEIKNT